MEKNFSFGVLLIAMVSFVIFLWQAILSPNAGRVDFCYVEEVKSQAVIRLMARDGTTLPIDRRDSPSITETHVQIKGHVPWRSDRVLHSMDIVDGAEHIAKSMKSLCDAELKR